MAEEASDAPADTGSEVDMLVAEFPDHVDFGEHRRTIIFSRQRG